MNAGSVDHLSPIEAQIEYARLAEELSKHDQLYYQEDSPIISDAQYDALRQRYEALEKLFPELVTRHSLTQKVGSKPSEKFAKIKHSIPMLSLGNVFTNDDVSDFVARVHRFLGQAQRLHICFTAEPKIDGLSCSLRYERGMLISAAPRGAPRAVYRPRCGRIRRRPTGAGSRPHPRPRSRWPPCRGRPRGSP